MVTASGYANGDDVFLAWALPHTSGCWGFAIHREVTTAAGKTFAGFIHNFVGFADDHPAPHSHRPSSEWPFQRYTWTDHGVDEGDTATYTIYPVLKGPGEAAPRPAETGATVGPITVTGSAGHDVHAFFNRGILLSQFMSKRLPENFTTADLKKLKKDLEADDSELRAFLTGQLGARLIRLLDDAATKGLEIYAALYELDDPVLFDALARLGQKAHVILANGSDAHGDGNATADSELRTKIDLVRRMLDGKGLGHNKFLVLAESEDKPLAVWTGSTNWATTGLCTQMQNAILVENEELARVYLAQWKLLRDDHTPGPDGKDVHWNAPLMDSNDVPKPDDGGAGPWTVWFTRTRHRQDLEAASQLIRDAEHAILFLMFDPGTDGLLQVIQPRVSEPALYVHGVVNTIRQPAPGDKKVEVELVGPENHPAFDLEVVEPDGIKDLPGWATEVTRRDFIGDPQHPVIGHAIVHSKCIVLDPFTNPIVITGSHNFSTRASHNNDENLIILRNGLLAERYAVNIMSTYQHYRWRKYVKDSLAAGKKPWDGLTKGDSWQPIDPMARPEARFWVRP